MMTITISRFLVTGLIISALLSTGGLARSGTSPSQLGHDDSLVEMDSMALSLPVVQKNEPEKFAFLVGINEYLYLRKLKGCVRDVELMEKVLNEKFGFPSANMKHLLDAEASHEAIEKGFMDNLIQKTKESKARTGKDAIVVFYFSGHGSQVTDTNGDEGDDDDETIVPFDSHELPDPNNKNDVKKTNFDIIDDELNEWFDKLNEHTSNITFIFDSCHSGTVTRDGADVLVKEVERDKRPQPKQKPLVNKKDAVASRDSKTSDMLSSNRKYVTISGCSALQVSIERKIDPTLDPKVQQPLGLLTYHLEKALRRCRPDTSYRALMEEVRRAVNQENKNQSPEVEGDINRFVFGGAASREDPFIHIAKVEGNQVTLEAGAAQGLQEGAFLAIYPERETQLEGDAKKLANAVVKKVVDLSTAIAELPDAKKNPKVAQVTEKSKAVLISSALTPLRVRFTEPTAAPSDRKTASALAVASAELKESKVVEIVETGIEDVKVSRSVFGKVFLEEDKEMLEKNAKEAQERHETPETPKPNDEIYYLNDGKNNPLFGFFVKVSDPKGGRKLAEALEKYARLRNLQALNNAVSPLLKDINVTVEDQTGELNKAGEFEVKKSSLRELPVGENVYPFKQDEYFKIKVENRSEKEVFVTIINVSTNGSITVMYPPLGSKGKVEPGKSILSDLFATEPPAGEEIFKIIVTTKYVDFSFLEQAAIKRAPESQLEALLSDTRTTARVGSRKEASVGDWGTKEIRFLVSKEKKK